MWTVKHRSIEPVQDYITADETGSVVCHLCPGFSLTFCSVAVFTLSDDILRTSLMDCENLTLILMLYKRGGVGCSNICTKQKNNNGWWSFQLHAFSCVGSSVSITHTKTSFFFFSFSITWLKAIGIPGRANKAFISQSLAAKVHISVPLKLKGSY